MYLSVWNKVLLGGMFLKKTTERCNIITFLSTSNKVRFFQSTLTLYLCCESIAVRSKNSAQYAHAGSHLLQKVLYIMRNIFLLVNEKITF